MSRGHHVRCAVVLAVIVGGCGQNPRREGGGVAAVDHSSAAARSEAADDEVTRTSKDPGAKASPRNLLDQGRDLNARGQWAEAMLPLQDAIAQVESATPVNQDLRCDVRYELGVAYAGERRNEPAIEAFATCGDFEQGFLVAQCQRCGDSLRVPFACKSRGVCPSCMGRRAFKRNEMGKGRG